MFIRCGWCGSENLFPLTSRYYQCADCGRRVWVYWSDKNAKDKKEKTNANQG